MATDDKTLWKGTSGTKEAPSDTENEGQISTVHESALLRKLDLRLLPGLCILYLLSFLDRSNGTLLWHGSCMYQWKLIRNSGQRETRGTDYGFKNEYVMFHDLSSYLRN
jgi:hypothetical protein